MRTFSLQNISEPAENARLVIHLHYTAWPDHGIPESPVELLGFMNLVGKVQQITQNLTAPVVVHCSAGVGRTGTLISIWNCLTELRLNGKCSVPCVLQKLRSERFSSVTSLDQYLFIYQTVKYYIEGLLKRCSNSTKNK